MREIKSRENQKLKLVRKIRTGRVNNLIFIEGLRLTFEALKSNLEFSEIFMSESFFSVSENKNLLDKLKTKADAQISLLSDKLFKSISDTKSPQGIILIATKPNKDKVNFEISISPEKSQNSILLLLHNINNPSNLGAIMRTAEAAGVLGIITTNNSANAFSPKVIRGAMGSNFRIPIWEKADFDEAIEWAKSNEFKTICADINSQKNYKDINWKKNYLIVFGSEGHGLSVTEREKIDESIYIPMENQVESLNLAVSCGIILFEAKNSNS